MTPMTLSVPAREEWVLVLRMAASGVCALHDIPLDVRDDLNTAIEESCDLLLHQRYRPEALLLSCERREDGLVVSLSAQGEAENAQEEPADADVAQLIIETLVREVALDQDEGGVRRVRMTLSAGG